MPKRCKHEQGLPLAELPDFTTPEGIAAWTASPAPVLNALDDGLGGNVEVARQHLRHLLPEPITVTPQTPDSWTVAGLVAYKGVALYLDGRVEDREVRESVDGQVVRRSRVGKWCPRGDSNTRHAV